MDLKKILEKNNISEAELIELIKSSKGKPSSTVKFGGKTQHVKYGYMSDTHIGHVKFDEGLFNYAAETFNKEKVDFVLHPGDHVEGMSGRPGHIYELNQIGFQAQINKTAELYSQIKAKIYGIDGNHDHWYVQKNNGGAYVGKTLEKLLPNFVNLGEWEGDLIVGDGLKIKLFHGNDGTAYADSYKLQKLIESFSGGEKPNIVHSGHYHKHIYIFRRNVHGFESATLCGQSGFMRGKKIPAHKGFGVVDVYFNKNGVQRLDQRFYPAYD